MKRSLDYSERVELELHAQARLRAPFLGNEQSSINRDLIKREVRKAIVSRQSFPLI